MTIPKPDMTKEAIKLMIDESTAEEREHILYYIIDAMPPSAVQSAIEAVELNSFKSYFGSLEHVSDVCCPAHNRTNEGMQNKKDKLQNND